jgi:Tol biopolymer transport system component
MKRIAPIFTILTVFALASSASASSTGDVIYSDAFDHSGIWAVNPDGTDPTHLVTEEAYRPRWAPDGSGVAFATGSRTRRIQWIDADGTNLHTLISPSELPPDWQVSHLGWSPDGTQLLVTMLGPHYTRHKLFVFPKNGSSRVLISREVTDADWGSNDKIVATGKDSLVIMNPDGSHVRAIDGTEGGQSPRWSPDASHIVFQRNYEIWVIDPDGQHAKRLTHTEALDWSPTWSPSGARIMWSRMSDWDTWAELWVMQEDGSRQRRVTFTPDVDEYEPDWR